MAAAQQLSDFVRDALARGHGEPRIRAALQDAGWSVADIDGAMGAWAVAGDMPPVPRPRPHVSAREAMLYALLMIALVLVCFHVLRLGFLVIDAAIRDVADDGPRNVWSMRFSMAAIIAFLPLFVLLDHRLARNEQAGRDRQRRSQARRVYASLTVLAAALVLLGDAVSVIYAFLSGDLTPRLAAKCALVAIMGLLVAACYREDLND